MKTQTIIYSLLLFSMAFASCKKNNIKDEKSYNKDAVACGVKNPIENLSWLNGIYNNMEKNPNMGFIALYEYNGEQVINVHSIASSSSYGYTYTCEGKPINFDGRLEIDNYLENRKEIAVLYGKNFQLQEALVLDGGPIATENCGWIVKIGDFYYSPTNLPNKFKKDKTTVLLFGQPLNEDFICGNSTTFRSYKKIKIIEIKKK